MKYKLSPLEIPQDEPFRHDALDRQPSVEAVARLIEELQGPFVLAIDSPWGTGKTTFVQLLKAVLESKDYSCLYFDAWKTDFSTDPLVAFLGEIGTQISSEIKKDSNFQKAKKIGSQLVKRAIPVAAKIATAGILDLDAVTEKNIGDGIADTLSDAVDDYLEQRGLIEEFRSSLSKVIAKLNEDGKKAQIIIFVDEIDRCRPVYAVELLERIKHLFNIENVIFVISLDKQQLHNSLGAVYGQGINSDEYLRRFIDLEYMLPKPDALAFTNNLFNRFEFDRFFAQRTRGEFGYEKQQLIDIVTELSDAFALSLRAREQCFTRIRVAMMTISENHPLHPDLLTVLMLLKIATPEIYRRYAFGGGTAREVIDFLKTKGWSYDMYIELSLVIAKAKSCREEPEELQQYRIVAEDHTAEQQERERAQEFLEKYKVGYRQEPPLSYIVNKIELAAQFR